MWRAGQASNGRSAGQWAPPAAAVAGRRGVGRSPAAGEGKGGAEGERERMGGEGRSKRDGTERGGGDAGGVGSKQFFVFTLCLFMLKRIYVKI